VLTRPAALLVALGLVGGGCGAIGHSTGDDAAAAAELLVSGRSGIGDAYFPRDGNGGIDVRSYAVHDRYRFSGRLSGRTVVTLRATERLRSFHLDFLLPVSRVRLSTGPSGFSRPDPHELRIRPRHAIPAGSVLRATVWYAGRPARYGYAGESNWFADGGEVEAVNQPHMAPWWFPANDHPLDKARMDLHVTVPRGKDVVANGRLIGVRRHGRLATYHWGGGRPMATYLAFFVAGRFEVRRGTSHRLPYVLAVSRALDRGQRRAAMRGLSSTPEIVTWLQKQLGRYPFGWTGGVVTSLNPGFALENQTRPVYPVGVSRLLMVHELSHQWFGDSVSVHHWADIWTNEGFATYMEHRWTEAHGGQTTSRWLRETYKTTPESSPFWDLVIADPGPGHLFDWPVYQRGAMALAALRNRIGKATFADLLHRWTVIHRYGHGSTDSFERLAEKISGQDLTTFYDEWVRQPDRPAETAANGL
jgi:aminopeptidase N